MASPLKGRLLWKLLLVQVLVLTASLTAAWLAVDYLARDSFMALMKQFSINPAEVEAMFLASTRTALVQVGLVALAVAFAFSYWLTRRILRPLAELKRGSERIAAGDYAFRIPGRGGTADELDALVLEFNAMAAALERIEKARKGMVVDVAHELRTPLTNLRGTIEALQDGLLPLDRSALGVLQEELLRLIRLTEDLIAAARPGAARHAPARRVPSDLRALLRRTIRLFRARLERRSLTIDAEVDALQNPVAVDPDQMQQVFGNLLQNALQFSARGSVIRIAGEWRADRVRIAFANEGEAIPEADLPRVFEPYYRVDRSRSRAAGGGAGLGLAIVREIVEAHGGAVGAASEAGRTRVWISLPALPGIPRGKLRRAGQGQARDPVE